LGQSSPVPRARYRPLTALRRETATADRIKWRGAQDTVDQYMAVAQSC
jgi:hypothetical protein